MLLLRTIDGVFRRGDDGRRITDRRLNGGGGLTAIRVKIFGDTTYAATQRALYRSIDILVSKRYSPSPGTSPSATTPLLALLV